MNYKRLTAILIVATMLGMLLPVLPVASEHPCGNYPIFEVKVEGKSIYATLTQKSYPGYIKLSELTYGTGKKFTVEVWILGVQDMYAYEFTLSWCGSKYWILWDYKVENVWPQQIVVKPDIAFDNDLILEKKYVPIGYGPVYGRPKIKSYTQVVSALPPSTGISGDIKLATLTFYIYNDLSYPDAMETLGGYSYVSCTFNVTASKVSDSCSQEIKPCTPHEAIVRFYSASPDIMMKPETEVNSAIWPYDGKFTKEIWISDIVRMKSLHFDLYWNWWPKPDCTGYNPVLELEQVEWNEELLKHRVPAPTSNWTLTEDAQVGVSKLHVDLEMKCDQPELRGEELLIMTLTFKKLDPWFCGYQPEYTFKQPHTWTPENATVHFWFHKGWFDVHKCDLINPAIGPMEKDNIYFGEVFDVNGDGCGDPLGDEFTAGYGKTDWIVCHYPTTKSGGGSLNLTTYVALGDLALVSVGAPETIDGGYVYQEDINKIGFWVKGAGGVYMAVIANRTGLATEIPVLWIAGPSGDTAGAWAKYTGEIPAVTWYLFTWDGENWSTAVYASISSTWANIPLIAQYKVLGFALFMGSPNTVNAGSKGTNVADLIELEISDPRGNYPIEYDLEPPYMTDYWWSEDLWDLTQHYIVNLYTFMPVPGDLNRDGVVDIVDIMIIASMYGIKSSDAAKWAVAKYYNFNNDGLSKDIVDIFDIVVVAKNFGRTKP